MDVPTSPPKSGPESRTRRYSLSLVLPAYNEAAGIAQAVAEADAALKDLVAGYEILVVDDGSRDDTAAIVQRLIDGGLTSVRLIRHGQNRGYGAALRTGFEAARFERVAFTDADCQFYLADLGGLLELTDHHDIAVGFRVDRQDPPRRIFFSRGYNLIIRTLLGSGVRDVDCALKVFRREVIHQVLPETRGFFVNTEMLCKARRLGLSVAETGVRHRPRLRGVSKVSLLDIPRTLSTLLPFWWSRVLFPARPEGQDSGTSRGWDLGFAAVCLVAGLLFFARLGTPLQEPEETRYAEIPRQMLAAGSFAVPVQDGLPYLDKPPLLYWMVMTAYRCGGVNDRSARFVPGLCGFLTVVVTYLWGRSALSPRAGLAAALLLCLSPRYVYLARLLTMNTLLGLCVVAALWAAHQALAGRRLRVGWWVFAGLATGGGLLAKGPVTLVLVGVPVFGLMALDRRIPRVGWGWVAGFAGAALGLSAPWYARVWAEVPEFSGLFFWHHHVERFFSPFDHAAPLEVWYYLPELILGMFPATLLIPTLIGLLARRSGPIADRRPAGLGLIVVSFVVGVIFFSAAGCKRPGYIVPAMPPLALALGWCLETMLAGASLGDLGSTLGRRLLTLSRSATFVLLSLGLIAAVVLGVSQPRWAGAVPLAVAAAAGLVLAVVLSRLRPFLSPGGACVMCGAVTFAVLLVGVVELLPGYARSYSMRGQVRPHAGLAATSGLPVLCYPRRWDSVSFYLDRNDVRVFGREQAADLVNELRNQPAALVFVKSSPARDSALEEFLRRLPGELEFIPRGRSGTVTAGVVRRKPSAERKPASMP